MRPKPLMRLALAALILAATPAAGAAQSLSVATGPDAEEMRATGSLAFFYDLFTFRGEGGRTEVVASFAVPVDRLEREDVGPDTRYRFDVTLVLADTALRSVSRTDDSVFVQVPGPLDGDHLLHTHVEVSAPPSASTVQRVLMFDATTPGHGQLYGAPFAIPDYRGSELMLSDVVLGLPGAGTGWRRGDVTLAVLPTSQFPQSSFDVYYEVYNLPEGHAYSTEISVEQLTDEDGDMVTDGVSVHTRFRGESGAGEGDALAELRRVDASLDEGRYVMTVVVTDEVTGEVARTQQRFEVRGWGPGITMVPALPSARVGIGPGA